jgi:glycosyltransferase involved in cell wall biosynthesis
MRDAADGGVQERYLDAIKTARQFTWERTANQLVEGLESVGFSLRRLPRHSPRKVRGSKESTLTIACPARNTPIPTLRRMLESARDTWWHGPVEVLIVDDASDPPIQLEWPEGLRGRIIRAEDWIGEGPGRALLIEEASGDWMFLTDSDVAFIQSTWALRLLGRALQEGGEAIVHPAMVLGDLVTVWSLGGRYKHWGALGWLPASHWHENEKLRAACMEPRYVIYAPGAGWFARTELLRKYWQWPTGYYHPTIFGDVDMSLWFRMHGIPIVTEPRAVVAHYQGSFTVAQSSIAAQEERFNKHAKELLSWWANIITEEPLLGWHLPNLTGHGTSLHTSG